MRGLGIKKLVFAGVTLGMLLTAPAAFARESAEVRFLQAVPGVGEATLSAGGKEVGPAGFAEVTDLVAVPAGETDLLLTAAGGVDAEGSQTLEPGAAYTVIAMAKGDGAELVTFADETATSGVARLRMIHAAPELGEPDFLVDGKVIARTASYRDATPYRTLDPGSYEVEVTDPDSGQPILPAKTLSMAAGTSTSAVIVGSRGEDARLVVVDDDVTAPSSGPQAGFGGLVDSGGRPWGLALLAVLGAGLIGGAMLRRAQVLAALAAGAAVLALAGPGESSGEDLPTAEVAVEHAQGPRPPWLARTPRREGRAAEPVRVTVPSVGIDALVRPVGASAGGIEVPPVDRAGWFRGGPRPGEPGRTIVIGHRDSVAGPAIFADLPAVEAGAVVNVSDSRGRSHRYRVIRSLETSKDAFPAEAVYGRTRRSTIALITCGGPFDAASGHYRDNVIVLARSTRS